MSHFSTIRTQLRDQVLLTETLAQLGYRYEAGEHLLVNGEQGQKAEAQVLVDVGAGDYQVGFQQASDGTFGVCADWWRIEKRGHLTKQEFMNLVNRTYAHLALRAQARAQGYVVEDEKVLANGEIELVISEPL